MKYARLLPKSLFFYILLPMVIVAIGVSLTAIAIINPILRSTVEKNVTSDLLLAADLGMEICEEKFIDLLELRLSDDVMMRETVRRESMNLVAELGGRFEEIGMLIVDEDGFVVSSTHPQVRIGTELNDETFQSDGIIREIVEAHPYLLRAEYFPFWRWHIVSIISEQDAYLSLFLMSRTILIFLASILLTLVIALYINIRLAVKDPLIRIIKATGEISENRFPRLTTLRGDEIGEVTKAVDRMSERLRDQREKTEQALQSLRESEQRFRRIVENAQAGYFMLDPGYRIASVNEAWLRIFGYGSHEEVVGKRIFEVFSSEERDHIDELLSPLGRGTPIPSGELRRVKQDGSTGYSTFSANPVYKGKKLVGFEGFLIDTTDQKLYQETLERSLQEKNVLLQEIHHRVKNNLNIVVSLLNLQVEHIRDVADAKKSIQVSCDRIYSMALVHEKLYQSDNIAFINIESYAGTILDELIAIYGAHLELDLDLQIDEIELKITQAVPCGLILNELITNSLIHAFPDRTKGGIAIHFHSLDESRYQLIYQDDGIGFNGGEVISDDLESLGLRLIQILSEQLGGDPVFKGRDGFRFQLIIEK